MRWGGKEREDNVPGASEKICFLKKRERSFILNDARMLSMMGTEN